MEIASGFFEGEGFVDQSSGNAFHSTMSIHSPDRPNLAITAVLCAGVMNSQDAGYC